MHQISIERIEHLADEAFYYTSKNRSGAWCSMTGCGSRFKARVYRQRRTAHLEEEPEKSPGSADAGEAGEASR